MHLLLEELKKKEVFARELQDLANVQSGIGNELECTELEMEAT